ncbi:uncharacterized protein BO97DRAFT_410369 [Aspergillus homomorphus CBS 101889]|uniref:Uncharacterized protein n=1 Tax=Aspergillus homomorphus (strain CBS 101889) TaxID=1450537 RepID=A0A395I9F2_ASPHC|nr:hypothetical protein BO97DRAFT_410369 [Aspergillus homomorphus CBS 101889]RAL16852.1 hypothetical protein BO97DRAFT_410369 [Aspergillus homomorphus CBS 101889]
MNYVPLELSPSQMDPAVISFSRRTDHRGRPELFPVYHGGPPQVMPIAPAYCPSGAGTSFFPYGPVSPPIPRLMPPNAMRPLPMQTYNSQMEMDNVHRLQMEQYRFPGQHPIYEPPGLAPRHVLPLNYASAPNAPPSPMQSYSQCTYPTGTPLQLGILTPQFPGPVEGLWNQKQVHRKASGENKGRATPHSTLRPDAPEFVPRQKSGSQLLGLHFTYPPVYSQPYPLLPKQGSRNNTPGHFHAPLIL